MGEILGQLKEWICPRCGSKEISVRGCSPDGTNMNYVLDCLKCESSFKEEN